MYSGTVSSRITCIFVKNEPRNLKSFFSSFIFNDVPKDQGLQKFHTSLTLRDSSLAYIFQTKNTINNEKKYSKTLCKS